MYALNPALYKHQVVIPIHIISKKERDKSNFWSVVPHVTCTQQSDEYYRVRTQPMDPPTNKPPWKEEGGLDLRIVIIIDIVIINRNYLG